MSQVEGADGWSYGPFEHGHERGPMRVELIRKDGTTAEFTVPDFVNDPEDIREIALVVIGALEKWDRVQGLGG